MKPWEVLGRTRTPGGTELTLTRHTSEYAILVDGQSLMTSRVHGSEDALAVLGCSRARTLTEPRVLVGGLGMGFTLRAALDILPARAEVVVAELVPEVVEWNRGPLGPLANHPLTDPRVVLDLNDVLATMRSNPGGFDAVLLDVDNGSDALIVASNALLYDRTGIDAARSTLRPGGVLAVWSAKDDRQFERRLRAGGFTLKREHARGRPKKGGPKYTILLAHHGNAPA